jgi:hypothetical protein
MKLGLFPDIFTDFLVWIVICKYTSIRSWAAYYQKLPTT